MAGSTALVRRRVHAVPEFDGAVAPAEDFSEGHVGHRRRRPVEDGGDVGHGVVYASRPASAFWRFCSKKLAISPAIAVQSSASIARNSWAVMTGEEMRRTTLEAATRSKFSRSTTLAPVRAPPSGLRIR